MKRILLLYGGKSSEHDVSIRSAKTIYDSLTRRDYLIELCYIDRKGKWWRQICWGDTEDMWRACTISPAGTFIITTDGTYSFDTVFPILHGKNGEDGVIQALSGLLATPVVGPSLIGAAITMDKLITKQLVKAAGIPVVEWIEWNTSSERPNYDVVVEKLGPVVFVKPVNAGSSVGVSKVINNKEYDDALNLAALHDSVVVIETAIDAREIEVAVLGNDDPKAATPGEIIPGEDFYSYEDKYSTTSESITKIPADLTKEQISLFKEYALRCYQCTKGKGMARVDFFLDKNGSIYLNEINSIPGFTSASMYPKMWLHDGMEIDSLIEKLVELADQAYTKVII